MIENKNKDIIELWWEYLKRSERYREFCQWWNQGNNEPLPESLKEYHQVLWNTYMHFGDVHSQTFEKWWESELGNPLPSPIRPYYAEPGKSMVDYTTVIEKDIHKIYRKFKKEQGREPNIKELIHHLKLYMTHWKNEREYLLIEYQHKSTKEISTEFHEYLRERKKEPPAKKASQFMKGMKGAVTIKKKPDTIEELQRYLRAYDSHVAGKTISHIANEMWSIDPNFESDNPPEEDSMRIVKRDIQKAKKIISNVEYGYFPGDF
jgi:hypothetical protein